MYRAFFEMVGAFAIWALSGFKGKYEDRLGRHPSYSNAFYGIVFFLFTIALVIVVVRLF